MIKVILMTVRMVGVPRVALMDLSRKIVHISLLFMTLGPAAALAVVPETGTLPGQNMREMGFEASREFSGKLFMEMQNKPEPVKLDFILQPADSAPLKLSRPVKRAVLGSRVKMLVDDSSEDETGNYFKGLGVVVTIAVTGIGATIGGLAAGLPGAVIGGAIAYGAYTAAKKPSLH